MNTEKATLNLLRSEIRALDAQIRRLVKVVKLTAAPYDFAHSQLVSAENQKEDLLRRAKELQA